VTHVCGALRGREMSYSKYTRRKTYTGYFYVVDIAKDDAYYRQKDYIMGKLFKTRDNDNLFDSHIKYGLYAGSALDMDGRTVFFIGIKIKPETNKGIIMMEEL
jgi:hypothetical protein